MPSSMKELCFVVAIVLVLNTEIFADNATSDDDICYMGSYKQCGPPKDYILELPENEDEMAERCSEYNSYFQCQIDFKKKCPEDWIFFDLEAIQETLKKFCDPNLEFYKAIPENSKCIKSVFLEEKVANQRTCFRETRMKNPEKYDEMIYMTNLTVDVDYVVLDEFFSNNNTNETFEYENITNFVYEPYRDYEGINGSMDFNVFNGSMEFNGFNGSMEFNGFNGSMEFNESMEFNRPYVYYYYPTDYLISDQEKMESCLYDIMERNCFYSQLVEDCGETVAETYLSTIKNVVLGVSSAEYGPMCRNYGEEIDEFIRSFNMLIKIEWNPQIVLK